MFNGIKELVFIFACLVCTRSISPVDKGCVPCEDDKKTDKKKEKKKQQTNKTL